MNTTTYHAIRVDAENNADAFWVDLRNVLPHVAKSLERNDCAIVSHDLLMRIDSLGGFNGEPSPLIDCGTEGEMFSDVMACRHEVIEA